MEITHESVSLVALTLKKIRGNQILNELEASEIFLLVQHAERTSRHTCVKLTFKSSVRVHSLHTGYYY